MLSPSASSVLAAATTIHLGLALLRNHRRHAVGVISPIALISFSFAALPWIFPTAAGLGLGLAAHIAWFVACEQLLAPTLAPAAARTAAANTPSAGVAPPRLSQSAAPAPRPATSGAPSPRPKGFVQTPVIAIVDETADIKTFRVARPDGFEFEAGQFVAVRVRVDGHEYVRCYSISSAPGVRGYLEISVKRLGTVSSALHATARPGALLSLKAPAGAFRYPAGDNRPLLFLAGGIGITPLISMLRHAVASDPTRPVTFIYSVHTESDFGFGDDLGAIARRHPQVRMYFAASGATRPSIYRGRIDETLLRTVVPDLVHSIAYVCGPAPMIDGMRTLLARLGVPKPQVRFEFFQPGIAAVARIHGESQAERPPVSVRVPAGRQSSYDMHCARSRARVPVRPAQTILDAAATGGVYVPSLCRAGVCGTCCVQVTAGDVHCESTILSDDERDAGFVLACVSTVTSDCTVQL